MKIEIEMGFLVQLDKERRHGHALKTIALRGDRVRPGKKIVNSVAAESVGGRRPGESSGVVGGLDSYAFHDRALFIADIAQQASGGNLSFHGKRQNQKKSEKYKRGKEQDKPAKTGQVLPWMVNLRNPPDAQDSRLRRQDHCNASPICRRSSSVDSIAIVLRALRACQT